MAIPKATLLSLLPLISPAAAWGALGHDTAALIAQSFISPKTAKWAKSLLNDTSATYLGNVASWADSYRSTAEGSFSGALHYIDALDTPPSSCSVDFERDCPEEGCIVSAIANYTSRVSNKKLSFDERQKALKWVIHFLGDIHQPLHVENLNVGGNTINVTYNGTKTNLHHIWDSNMAEQFIGGYSIDDARNWSTSLVHEIKGGKYAKQRKAWLKGMKLKDGIGSAMIWARDANAFVCSTVVPQGVGAVEGHELDGEYYDAAIPVIQLQIAKAGYRLAAWLNLIVEGKTGLEGNGSSWWSGWSEKRAKSVRRRGEAATLEEWMVEARRVRRAFGWNCGPEGHKH